MGNSTLAVERKLQTALAEHLADAATLADVDIRVWPDSRPAEKRHGLNLRCTRLAPYGEQPHQSELWEADVMVELLSTTPSDPYGTEVLELIGHLRDIVYDDDFLTDLTNRMLTLRADAVRMSTNETEAEDANTTAHQAQLTFNVQTIAT